MAINESRKSALLHVRVRPELLESVRRTAGTMGLSESEVIRLAVSRFCRAGLGLDKKRPIQRGVEAQP